MRISYTPKVGLGLRNWLDQYGLQQKCHVSKHNYLSHVHESKHWRTVTESICIVSALTILISGGLIVDSSASQPKRSPDSQSYPSPLALTPTEYNNTVADLFGLPRNGEQWPARPAAADRISPPPAASKGVFVPPPPAPVWPWDFPAELGSNGFEGIVEGQNPSSYQVEELQLAAMHFSSFALVSPTFFLCDDWTILDEAERRSCLWKSLEHFFSRAYRRPISSRELERLKMFWINNTKNTSLDEALALTVAGILQAPAFHFRLEPENLTIDGQVVPLSEWQLATRLSYFLWDSMPDDELFVAARSGQLSSKAGIEKQAHRMLADPKARSAIVRFHHQWLGTDKVLLIAPARRAFGPLFGISKQIDAPSDDDQEWPVIMGSVRHSMKLETELFVEQTIFDGPGTFTDLMTSNLGFMSAATEAIYGSATTRLTQRPSVTRPIEFVALSIGRKEMLTVYPVEFSPYERAGVLTLPSVLSIGAYAVQPGPILRGKRVLERVACMDMGTPIQGAENALPPDTLSVVATNRQRTETATSPPTCISCHRFINPPGFAFEHYDAIGKWRRQDNGEPVNATGALTLSGGEEIAFSDGIDLVQQLAASSQVRDCYSLHWTRYALGHTISHLDDRLRPIREPFRENDSIKNLLVSIASSDLLRSSLKTIGSGATQ